MRPGRKAFRSFHEAYRVADRGRLRNVRSVKKKPTASRRVWPVASGIARAPTPQIATRACPHTPAPGSGFAATFHEGGDRTCQQGLSFLPRHGNRPRLEFISERSTFKREKAGLLTLLATGLRVGALRAAFSEVCNANLRERAGFSRLIQV